MESSQNFKQQSVSYLIGDLLKRNYSIYSQFLNIKREDYARNRTGDGLTHSQITETI
jgi:hypothetical protein